MGMAKLILGAKNPINMVYYYLLLVWSSSGCFNPFTPKSAKFKTEEKILKFMLQNCQKQTAPLLNSFHLNGHTLGHTHLYGHILLTQGLTLGVKGLKQFQWQGFHLDLTGGLPTVDLFPINILCHCGQCCSRKYPYPCHKRFNGLNPHPPWNFQFSFHTFF